MGRLKSIVLKVAEKKIALLSFFKLLAFTWALSSMLRHTTIFGFVCILNYVVFHHEPMFTMALDFQLVPSKIAQIKSSQVKSSLLFLF